VWLFTELRAQLTRMGLGLGVFAAASIIVGTALPMVEERRRVFGESPVGLDNALIAHREGWLLVALAAGIVLALAAYRVSGLLRPLVAIAIVALGLATDLAATRIADGPLLNPCTLEPVLCAPPDIPIAYQNRPAGYGFDVIALGSACAAISGVLLLVPAAAPRRRRWEVTGREHVVWL
jgi:hypothetical protein